MTTTTELGTCPHCGLNRPIRENENLCIECLDPDETEQELDKIDQLIEHQLRTLRTTRHILDRMKDEMELMTAILDITINQTESRGGECDPTSKD